MMKMNKEKFIVKINEIKEVLSNMPLNNKVNKEKYIEYVSSLISTYKKFADDILNEIKKRNSIILTKEKCEVVDLDKLNTLKNECLADLNILEPNDGAYEKLGLDKIIYNICNYRKENLDFVNEEILKAISCFKEVGLLLESNDFWYSRYLKEYMNVLLNEELRGSVREKLDQIYWKCPNIINQVAMNLISLYYKNEKLFEQYFVKKKENLLKGKSVDEVLNNYNDIVYKLDNEYYNIENISKRFLNGEDSIKDFSKEKYDSYKESICNKDVDSIYLDKLSNTLYEYSIYLKYKYIIDDVISIYKEKDKQKNVFKTLLSEISKEEKKIIKLNKKIGFQLKWKKDNDKIEILDINLNTIINGLIDKYKDLEIMKVNEYLSKTNDNLSYYDILQIVSTHYIYLRSILVKNNEAILDSEVNDIEKEIREFLLFNKLTILDNISVVDECNIADIISNRYKLLNIEIKSEELENGVDSFVELLRKIRIIECINKSNVSYDELLFQVESQSLIKK